jgi:hypothetical protein
MALSGYKQHGDPEAVVAATDPLVQRAVSGGLATGRPSATVLSQTHNDLSLLLF